MLKKIFLLLVWFLSILMFYSCSSVGESNSVSENLSWNEKDSEVIADSIVQKLLLSEWNTKFTSKRKPKIVVGAIEDLTNETIDTELLAKNIERSFINSGDVTFILSKSNREMARSDRKNSNDFDDDMKLKKYLEPLKSDFFISGSINLSIDSISAPNSKEYKLILKIIEIKELETVFITSQTLNK